MSVSNETKRQIIAEELRILENTIYSFTLKGKIAGDVGNAEAQKNCMAQLEIFEKTKKGYMDELANLDKAGA